MRQLQYRSSPAVRSLILGRWEFAPGLLPSIAALVAIMLFVELGFWQLRRADESQAQLATRNEREHLASLDLNRLAAERMDSLLWRSATVSGRWQAVPVLLLDNQMTAGRVGYLVFGLLRPQGCSCALLVNRGWVDAGPERGTIPELGRLPHAATLHGRLAPLPPGGVGVRNDVEHFPGGLMRVQRLELASIPLEPGIRLLPVTLRLDPESPDGFVRNWAPPANKTDRHLAYALQWFIFALIAAGLYGFLNLKSR